MSDIGFDTPATHGSLHLLIDSTGLRIHIGHLRQPPRNRAWRQLHLAVDAENGQIVSCDLTGSSCRDSIRVPTLLEQTNSLASLRADGAYDKKSVYEEAQKKGNGQPVRVLIPPARGARLHRNPSAATKERNTNVHAIRELGRREWHKQSGYSRRSMVDNTIYRYRVILGGYMRSRSMEGQRSEVQIGCKILNRMTLLGMPDSIRVA